MRAPDAARAGGSSPSIVPPSRAPAASRTQAAREVEGVGVPGLVQPSVQAAHDGEPVGVEGEELDGRVVEPEVAQEAARGPPPRLFGAYHAGQIDARPA